MDERGRMVPRAVWTERSARPRPAARQIFTACVVSSSGTSSTTSTPAASGPATTCTTVDSRVGKDRIGSSRDGRRTK
jgi:hypothetical protein